MKPNTQATQKSTQKLTRAVTSIQLVDICFYLTKRMQKVYFIIWVWWLPKREKLNKKPGPFMIMLGVPVFYFYLKAKEKITHQY